MIIADKILTLRKKANLSQEELAEKLNVSRQSVSKWESAVSIPDINKIMALSKLFDVSTDYLLRDDLEELEFAQEDKAFVAHMVTSEIVGAFLNASRQYAKQIALGVALCIMSPTPLILLSTLAKDGSRSQFLSSNVAEIVGLIWLFVSVAAAVGIFTFSGSLKKPYEYMQTGDFDLSYGVAGIIKERQSAFLFHRTKKVVISVSCFIIGVLPLILSGVVEASDFVTIIMLLIVFITVTIGVWRLIICETEKESYDQLLSEGEFEPTLIKKYKKQYEKEERISGIYWPSITAIYLGWSFISQNWSSSWIIWPVAALIYAAISAFFTKD